MAQKASSRPRLIQAMIDAFSLPDLRRRLLITFGILVVFRLVAHVPVPGVDAAALKNVFQNNALLGMLNMFSGGALKNFSIAAMGVYPYITASIVITLMTPIIPSLQRLAEEGESGRDRINTITHWLMVPLAGLSGYAQLVLMRNQGAVADTGVLATVAIILSLIAGSMFCVWLGEQITQYGIGNGVSIIIFAGIMAQLPTADRPGLPGRAERAGYRADRFHHHQPADGVLHRHLHRGAPAHTGAVRQERLPWRAHVPPERFELYTHAR